MVMLSKKKQAYVAASAAEQALRARLGYSPGQAAVRTHAQEGLEVGMCPLGFLKFPRRHLDCW